MSDKHEFHNDAGCRDEERALRRAALRAREIAARTGTPLVIYRDGKIEKLVVDGAVASAAEEIEPAAKAGS